MTYTKDLPLSPPSKRGKNKTKQKRKEKEEKQLVRFLQILFNFQIFATFLMMGKKRKEKKKQNNNNIFTAYPKASLL